MACIWAIMACFISMSLLAPAFMASMWVFIAASAASFLAMLSVMEVFILAIGSAATEGAGVTAGVSGVAVTVAEGAGVTAGAGAGAGAATIGGAGAGVAMGSGADAGAAVVPAVGAGAATTFWASAGIQNSDSAAINRRAGGMRTEFGRFIVVLLRQMRWTLGGVCPLRVLDGRGRGGTGIDSDETPAFSAGAWIGRMKGLDANGGRGSKSIVGRVRRGGGRGRRGSCRRGCRGRGWL